MNRNMAIIKLHVSFGVGIILICCVHHSLQDCPKPTNVDPNLVISPDQSTHQTYYPITLSCPSGYELTGPDTCYCGEDGSWSPDPSNARCEVATVPCSKPNVTDPDIVFTPDKTSYDTDETVTASCSSGTIHGDDVGVCLDDGTWEFSSEPSCKSDCLSPPNTNDTTGSYPHAETVTFFCREGFELAGGGNSNELTCDDGSWDLEFNCESAGCPLPSVPTDVDIELDPNHAEGDSYEVHSSVVLKCIGDRTLSGPGFSYCNETSQWDPDPMTIKCRDQCLTPSFDDSRIIHTSHLTGNSGQSFYDHTDTIKLSCEDGIFVDGPWKSACKDGVWSPPIGGYRPVCKKNCTVPENMSNEGAVFQHSKRHTFACNDTPGMVRMGGPLSVCSDEVWTPRIRCALKTDLRSEL
ncbi:sushi, von Willebrand factor type A, EGF and pentraxin domain-containing protein 1-like isoform X1 [Lytechinus pictus]